VCSVCGFPQTAGHWSEAGNPGPHDRVRARFVRARKLDGVLRNYGLTAYDDGVTPGIQIADRTGNVVIAQDLREVWIAAEKLAGEVIDPLDPRFNASNAGNLRLVS